MLTRSARTTRAPPPHVRMNPLPPPLFLLILGVAVEAPALGQSRPQSILLPLCYSRIPILFLEPCKRGFYPSSIPLLFSACPAARARVPLHSLPGMAPLPSPIMVFPLASQIATLGRATSFTHSAFVIVFAVGFIRRCTSAGSLSDGSAFEKPQRFGTS